MRNRQNLSSDVFIGFSYRNRPALRNLFKCLPHGVSCEITATGSLIGFIKQ